MSVSRPEEHEESQHQGPGARLVTHHSMQHPQKLERSPLWTAVMLLSNSMTVCSQLHCFVKRWMPFFFFFLNSLLPSGEGFHGYKRWHSQHNNIVLSQTPVLLAKLGTTYISSGNKHRIIQSLQYKSELCLRFVIICYSRLVWIVQIPILMHYFGTYNDAS